MVALTNDFKPGGFTEVHSQSSGAQESETVAWARPCSFWGLQGRIRSLLLPVPVAAGVPWLAATSLQPLPSWSQSLLLFCLCLLSLCFPLTKTRVIGFGAHPQNPAGSPHVKILNCICKEFFSEEGNGDTFWGSGRGYIHSIQSILKKLTTQ